MNLSSLGIPILVLILVAGVFFAGCSDSTDTGTSDTTTSTPVTTSQPSASPVYSAGDIVKNPKSASDMGLLIISYDAGTDMYERALIYPNSDGSWGYRVDAKTEKMSRTTLEKTYSSKIKTVSVSSIPTSRPTTVATTRAATATPTVTTTTTTVYTPKVKSIEPDKGTTGTNVSITELAGENFKNGAKVSLKRSGESAISAQNVNVENSELIKCTFVIPDGTRTGYWNVVVTNPDGKYHEFQNAFNVLAGTTTTTTTSSSSTTKTSAKITITQIQDTLIVLGGVAASSKEVGILGVNLSDSSISKMQLTGPSTITATTYYPTASSLAKGYFNIPAGTGGNFHVVLIDASGNTLATSPDTTYIQP